MRPLPALAAFRRKPLAIEMEPAPAGHARRPSLGGGSVSDALSGALAVADLADCLERDIAGGLNAVAKTIHTATADVRATGEDLARLDADVKHLASAGQGAATQASELATASQDLAAESREFTNAMALAAARLREAVSCARGARTMVADLARAIEEIVGVVDTISAVARQTNLLALNATIEAARAGPAGHDFAVVANEVKSLSVETSNAATDIQARIATLRDSAGASMRVVEKVVSAVQEVQPLFGAVRAAVDEQNASVAELGQRATKVSASIEKVSSKAQRIGAAVAKAAGRVAQAGQTTAGAEALTNALGQRVVTVVRQTEGADRRRHDRYPVELAATLFAGGRAFATHTIDISAGGVLLSPVEGLAAAAGSTLDFDLERVGQLSARIVAASALGLHCAFDHVSPMAHEGLTRLIADIEAEYRPLIAIVTKAAQQVQAAFEQAVHRGRLSREQLFDTKYRPIPGTNPAQYGTAYLQVLEELLPSIQEPLLLSDHRLVLCCAIDRNGYVPVHNRKYSQPQRPGDVAWNAANCRNKRIFDEWADLIAARSSRPFVIHSFIHETQDSRSVTVREISVPIQIFGRHWGGFRAAYQF